MSSNTDSSDPSFLQSYGVWMCIAEMLTQQEVVCLQAASRYMYDVGVPRVIAKFRLPVCKHHFIPIYRPGETILIHYDTRDESCSWISHPLIQLGNELTV